MLTATNNDGTADDACSYHATLEQLLFMTPTHILYFKLPWLCSCGAFSLQYSGWAVEWQPATCSCSTIAHVYKANQAADSNTSSPYVSHNEALISMRRDLQDNHAQQCHIKQAYLSALLFLLPIFFSWTVQETSSGHLCTARTRTKKNICFDK